MSILYGIADSAFHGGGILYTSRSPRQTIHAMRRLHDGCFDGNGCQGFVASDDDGETWYPIVMEQVPTGDFSADYRYADMGVRVDEIEIVKAAPTAPLRPASKSRALDLALEG